MGKVRNTHPGQQYASKRKRARRLARRIALTEEAKRHGISVSTLMWRKFREVNNIRAEAGRYLAEISAARIRGSISIW